MPSKPCGKTAFPRLTRAGIGNDLTPNPVHRRNGPRSTRLRVDSRRVALTANHHRQYVIRHVIIMGVCVIITTARRTKNGAIWHPRLNQRAGILEYSRSGLHVRQLFRSVVGAKFMAPQRRFWKTEQRITCGFRWTLRAPHPPPNRVANASHRSSASAVR